MKLHEYEPFGDRPSHPQALWREDSEVLTCGTCGCRLTARTSLADGAAQGPDSAWRHFPGMPGRDARGCDVDCVDAPHRLSSADPIGV